MDGLWTITATAGIVVIGLSMTVFVIQPIHRLQKVRLSILEHLVEYTDVYGVTSSHRKYQARETFRQSASQLNQARQRIPFYTFWAMLLAVPKCRHIDDAQEALQVLSNLAVQVIDHQVDLTKRRAEREQVTREAAHQGAIIKQCLRIQSYELFRDQ